MQRLRPCEYRYLDSPFLCIGEELLALTLQDLCIRKAIHIENRYIYLNEHDSKPFLRTFFSRGVNFETETYSKADLFFTDFFDENDEYRIHEIRTMLMKSLDSDPHQFKTDYVYDDLSDRGLCDYRYFLTDEGKESYEAVKEIIQQIEDIVELDYFENQIKTLKGLLTDLGTNYILLNDEVIEKLNISHIQDEIIGEQNLLADFSISSNATSGYEFGSFSSLGSVGSFGGSFGGFGGGSFSGGGSSGSW